MILPPQSPPIILGRDERGRAGQSKVRVNCGGSGWRDCEHKCGGVATIIEAASRGLGTIRVSGSHTIIR